MSMISAQCDKLREWASELRVLANGPVNEGFPARANLFDSADAMCQAADTIWELRCKMADMVDQREEIERLKANNAKLRELVRELWEGYNDPRCEECHLKDTPTCADCPICAREAQVIDCIRELGVEVGG